MKYITPEIEAIVVEAEDIILASGGTSGGGIEGDGTETPGDGF